MTTYTAIANAEIDAESPITTTLMTLLRDNPIAVSEGSAGAPKIQTAALDQTVSTEAVSTATMRDGAVVRVKLATTTVSLAGTIGGSSDFDIALSPYSFFPMFHSTDAQAVYYSLTDYANPDAPHVRVIGNGKGSQFYDIDYRHVIA